jgi:uncharacterized protein YkwD
MPSTPPSPATRRARPRLEELEPRQLLSGFQPTAAEQLFLERLNDARANPAAYGASIGVDLSGVAPAPPLAFDPRLVEAARRHSQDMAARDYFAHDTPGGVTPGQRLTAEGFPWTSWGESVAANWAFWDPNAALRALVVDDGVPSLGHRRQLLAADAVFRAQEQVGVGFVHNWASPWVNYYTVDTASTSDGRPFLTGVAFNDVNGNGKYDIGEGRRGVRVNVAGVGMVTTFASGGYSLRLNPGRYTVTASGGGLKAPLTQAVTVGATSYRLNFVTDAQSQAQRRLVQALYRTALGRAPGAGEVDSWAGVLRGMGVAPVVNGIERSAEARDRLVRGWYATYLGRRAVGGEERGWVNALLRGATEEQVLAGILGSPEFYGRARSLIRSGTADEKFIRALYRLLLKRDAGAAEVRGWLNVLPALGRAGLAQGILGSAEFRAREVRLDYAALLHRRKAPTAAEVNGWVASGLDATGLRVAFESSAEFRRNS